MKQTEQYGLNQWELTDRIRMADFNTDNAKIAAALAGKTGRLEKITFNSLGSPSLGLGTKPFVSNWNEWEMTLFFLHANYTPAGAASQLKVQFECSNGSTQPQVVALLEPDSLLMIFFPRHDENSLVEGAIIGGGTKVFQMPFSFKHLSRMSFGPSTTTSQNFFQDAHIRHFGIR